MKAIALLLSALAFPSMGEAQRPGSIAPKAMQTFAPALADYGATVSFQPGARSNWHTHPLGQLLIVTDGRGWVQAEGEPVRVVGPGDVVWTAPGVKHWHGATPSRAMTHVAVSEALDGSTVQWLEPVGNAQYRGPQ